MPVNAKQIRELMELGLDGDTLIKVVAVFDRADLTKKQRAAESSKRYRERLNSRVPSSPSSASYDATKPSDDEHDAKKKSVDKTNSCRPYVHDVASYDADDGDNALLLTKNLKEESKKVRARRKTSMTLRDDWRPSEVHFTAATRLNLPVASVYAKADDMRLWAKSTDARKVDWDATFHGFLRREAERKGTPPPTLSPAEIEASFKKPPPEYLERERQRNAAKATGVRSDAAVGHNGAGHAPELQLSGGRLLRDEIGATPGDACGDHEG